MSIRQQIRTTPPINPNYWSFALTGSVRHPLILSLEDLRRYQTVAVNCVLSCSGSPTRRPVLREASWRGVPLQTLLDQVEINAGAAYAHTFAADGYSSVLPLTALNDALLATHMNGAPLLPEDGFPARLIVPGRHGYKMPKWTSRIELHETFEGGFWETRGWSLEGVAGARAAILSHTFAADGSVELAGIIYGGTGSVSHAEISIDGAQGTPLTFTPGERETLARWQAQWMPPGTGDYQVRLRAYVAGGAEAAEHTLVVKVR